MPNYGLDPQTRRPVSITDWLKAGYASSPALCDICNEQIWPKAVSAVATSAHFCHEAHSRCPTVGNNRERFASLPPSGTDPANGRQVRREFLDNAYRVYTKCSGLCEGLRFNDFQNMVGVADTKKMWDYVGLTLTYVPYLLVSTVPIYKPEGARRFSFYFVFEPPRRHVDELWNQPNRLKQRIWRVRESDDIIDPYDINEEWIVEPFWFTTARRKL